jgi:hypothetical protein
MSNKREASLGPSSASSSQSPSLSNKKKKIVKEDDDSSQAHMDLQKDYVSNCNLSVIGLMQQAMKEVSDIDINTEDFGASDINFGGIVNAMRPSGPELNVHLLKRSEPKIGPEAIVTVSKAAELFILDLALRSLHSKNIEVKSHNEPNTITQADVTRAVDTHEIFDVFTENVRITPKRINAKIAEEKQLDTYRIKQQQQQQQQQGQGNKQGQGQAKEKGQDKVAYAPYRLNKDRSDYTPDIQIQGPLHSGSTGTASDNVNKSKVEVVKLSINEHDGSVMVAQEKRSISTKRK